MKSAWFWSEDHIKDTEQIMVVKTARVRTAVSVGGYKQCCKNIQGLCG